MLKGHSGASIDRLEAHFNLRIVNGMSSISIQKNKTDARLPNRDPSALESLASGLVINFNPTTSYTRFYMDAHRSR